MGIFFQYSYYQPLKEKKEISVKCKKDRKCHKETPCIEILNKNVILFFTKMVNRGGQNRFYVGV
jgi:hypothetical protein